MRARRSWPARLVPVLFTLLVAVVAVVGLSVHPQERSTVPTAERVVVLGAAGLRWQDLDPEQTPHLWRLAQQGAVGSLSVRSAHDPTCTVDGWLTLGAGNWAAGAPEPPAGDCPPLDESVERTAGGGAHLPAQEQRVHHNQWELSWGAVPGALAGSVGCTTAVGEGAAVAGARSYGGVDQYRAQLPSRSADTARLLQRCELALVDLGTVAGEGAPRAVAARQADAAVGRVLDARPEDTLVLTVGVADTDPDPHLHVAVAHAPHLGPGWLSSQTTGRTGYLQLVDVAPTVLAALDRSPPDVRLAGQPAGQRPDRPPALEDAVAELVAVDDGGAAARPVSWWFLAVLTAAQLALFGASVRLLRRPAQVSARYRTVAAVLLVAAALAVPAALLVGGVPWWRAPAASGVFAVLSLAVLAAASVLVVRTPLRRRTLWLVGACAGVAAAAVAVDLLTGSWLQLNGVVGYLAHDGGRYVGLSDTGLGVLVAGTMLLAGCLAARVPRARQGYVLAAVGTVGVVLAGSPYLGAEPGGAAALVAGVCVASACCAPGWVALRRVGWTAMVGVLVLATVAVAELQRPTQLRTGLGGMLTQLGEGTAGYGLHRLSQHHVEAFAGTPLTVLALGAGAFVWFALLRPFGGLRRLFGVHPALRAAFAGGTLASLLGGLLTGSALAVAGAAAAVAVPLLTLAALRLREHSVRRVELTGQTPSAVLG